MIEEVTDMLENDSPVAAVAEAINADPAPAAPAGPKSAEEAITAAINEGKDDAKPEVKAGTETAEPVEGEEPPVAEEAPVVAGAEAKPKAQPEAKPEPESDDPDAPPKGLSKKAQERFQALTQERTALRERLTQWNDTLKSAGADPQQMAGLLEYTRMLNSGDPAQLRGALDMAKGAVRDISVILGEDIQTIDPLDGHNDIAERVEQGVIDRQTAIELVRARQTQEGVAQRQQQAQYQQAQQAQQEQAKGHLDQLGATLRKQDPEFDAKVEALKPTIDVIAANLPPEQWATQFLSAYQSVKLPESPRLGVVPQPLRSSGAGATSVRQTPKSALEAVTAALGG